eukprot:TRINITY_DN8488_c0_g1_i1.p1 TRINITY_DN8488_c0_g1~~TRINITY_DN8488_c0_g1_i1.p1  ORF type:complete len:934 (-),score=260.47 TRINITY_DN8488_c0_g1_i1:84-2885(-)
MSDETPDLMQVEASEGSTDTTMNLEESSELKQGTKRQVVDNTSPPAKRAKTTTISGRQSKLAARKQGLSKYRSIKKEKNGSSPLKPSSPTTRSTRSRRSSTSGSNISETLVPVKKFIKKQPVTTSTPPPKKRKMVSSSESSQEEKKPAEKQSVNSEVSNAKSEDSDSKPKRPVRRSTRRKKQASSSSDYTSSSSSPIPKKRRKPARKPATKKKATPKRKTATRKRSASTKKSGTKKAATKKKPAIKKKKKEEEIYAWWDESDEEDWRVGEKKNWKWRTLSHMGVVFPDPYEPHNVPIKYKGKDVKLEPKAEELATFFSQYLETAHMQKPQFSTNFFKAFRKALSPENKRLIKNIKNCDFTPIATYKKNLKEEWRNRSKEVKQQEKLAREEKREKYGYAIIDGRREKLSNFTVEPPGLFLGRGDHPMAGMVKARMQPEDIFLNLDENAEVPPCSVEGHSWGGVVHNHSVSWIAFWRQNLTNSKKYVQFDPSASIRSRSDLKKFKIAQRLHTHSTKIRKKYTKELTSKDVAIRQRATAMWIIDTLALRVGNPKNNDKADTVGTCTLRVEHVTCKPGNILAFDFLGKDSMRYKREVECPPQVWKNFKSFMKNKRKSKDIFDKISVSSLNSHLKNLMKDLSAKVFRTYNASYCMQEQIAQYDEMDTENWTVDDKVLFFNRCSREVAILCNHQRTVSKTHEASLSKIADLIEKHKKEIKILKQQLKNVKAGKSIKVPKPKEGEKPMVIPKSENGIKNKIKRLQSSIKKNETKMIEKDELKTIATSTSKLNYIDPRISIAWAKKAGVPITKIFSATVRKKFGWAIDFVEKNPDFMFHDVEEQKRLREDGSKHVKTLVESQNIEFGIENGPSQKDNSSSDSSEPPRTRKRRRRTSSARPAKRRKVDSSTSEEPPRRRRSTRRAATRRKSFKMDSSSEYSE